MRMLELNGKRMSISRWAKELGISYAVIYTRIYRDGWSIKRALTTPKISPFKHGQSKTAFWKAWYNKKPLLCEEWQDFEVFRSEVIPPPKDRPVLTAIDTSMAIGPDNSQWITRSKRHEGPRKTYTFNGKTMTLRSWAKEIGISFQSIYLRLKAGWPLERALTTPRTFNNGGGRPERIVSFNGETKTLAEWSKRLMVTKTTLSRRLESWPIEEALTIKGRPSKYKTKQSPYSKE